MKQQDHTITAEQTEALKNAQPGEMITNQGIFLGQWSPADRHGKILAKTYYIFAAPKDLTDIRNNRATLTYDDTTRHLSQLKNWHGFDGADYQNDTALYQALHSGTYNGQWFIPPRDLLIGVDLDGDKVQSDNLYAHQNAGIFKGTFITAPPKGFDQPLSYWSCTEHRDYPSFVSVVRFSAGYGGWHPKNNSPMACRPVRAVEILLNPAINTRS